MTFYICQCSHTAPATVWTAESESEIIAACATDNGPDFNTAIEAVEYDKRDAYITTDPLDLYLWIEGTQAAADGRAARAFFERNDIRSNVEQLATSVDSDDDDVYTAFDGRFTWSGDAAAWRLGNQEPVEASDLFHALCDASIEIAKLDRMEQHDA